MSSKYLEAVKFWAQLMANLLNRPKAPTYDDGLLERQKDAGKRWKEPKFTIQYQSNITTRVTV